MPKILVIDDDVTALDLTDLLFRKHGFETKRLTNGIFALKTIKEFKPDIMIIDLLMPEISGQETISLVRKAAYNFPIIAFTAVDEHSFQEQALAAGCNMVLTKPCSPKVLLEHVNNLLKSPEIH